MTTAHTSEQGVRVHYLANLGGLVVVAGLDQHPPDLLLGLLLEAADRLTRLSPEQRAELGNRGQLRLDERGAAKRAWKAWSCARELQRLDLSLPEIRRLLAAIVGTEAAARAADPGAYLLRALRGSR